jgi:hypothetical protein
MLPVLSGLGRGRLSGRPFLSRSGNHSSLSNVPAPHNTTQRLSSRSLTTRALPPAGAPRLGLAQGVLRGAPLFLRPTKQRRSPSEQGSPCSGSHPGRAPVSPSHKALVRPAQAPPTRGFCSCIEAMEQSGPGRVQTSSALYLAPQPERAQSAPRSSPHSRGAFCFTKDADDPPAAFQLPFCLPTLSQWPIDSAVA